MTRPPAPCYWKRAYSNSKFKTCVIDRGMGPGILKGLLGSLNETAGWIAETRKAGKALWYTIGDGVKSAFAVFYFLRPSLLNFQREMKRNHKQNNLERLFGGKDTPCAEQIRNLSDAIEPASLEPAFAGAPGLARREVPGAGRDVVLFTGKDTLSALSDRDEEGEWGGTAAVLPRCDGGGNSGVGEQRDAAACT